LLPRRGPWRYAKKPVVHSAPQSNDGKKLKWFFHGSNPDLNVSKLFNELVRVPEMTGKLIILEMPLIYGYTMLPFSFSNFLIVLVQ